jgi:hypothetical protein
MHWNECMKIPTRMMRPLRDRQPIPDEYVPPLIFSAFHDMLDWLESLAALRRCANGERLGVSPPSAILAEVAAAAGPSKVELSS